MNQFGLDAWDTRPPRPRLPREKHKRRGSNPATAAAIGIIACPLAFAVVVWLLAGCAGKDAVKIEPVAQAGTIGSDQNSHNRPTNQASGAQSAKGNKNVQTGPVNIEGGAWLTGCIAAVAIVAIVMYFRERRDEGPKRRARRLARQAAKEAKRKK